MTSPRRRSTLCYMPAPDRLRRPAAAAALWLYVLVTAVLLPLHLLEEAPSDAGPAGPAVTVHCPGGCHEPAHGHGRGHLHDPATCTKCGAASAPALEPGSPADLLPTPASWVKGAASVSRPGTASASRLPPARAPPPSGRA